MNPVDERQTTRLRNSGASVNVQPVCELPMKTATVSGGTANASATSFCASVTRTTMIATSTARSNPAVAMD